MEIFFCNRTYNRDWLKDKKTSNSTQYLIIEAIVEAINKSDGNNINLQDVLDFDPKITEYVERRKFKIIPAGGQEFRRQGKGIRHAKYAPSKSVAVIWEKIRGTIYVTFDDHAPVRYHRAIHSFHRLRVGMPVFPLPARTSPRVLKKMRERRLWRYKGINLRDKHYY